MADASEKILEDEAAVRRTLAEYFLLQDAGEIDRLKVEYWTKDVVAELLVGTIVGPDALAARLHEIRAPKTDANGEIWDYRVYTHFLANSAISVQGDEAITTSSVVSISVREQRRTHVTETVFQGARYHDRLVRQDGTWRVA